MIEPVHLVAAPGRMIDVGTVENVGTDDATGVVIEDAQSMADADLAIDKTGPLTVAAGGLLTYTVTVHNVGPSDARNVVVTDTLPSGVLPVGGYPLTFDLGSLPAGETVTREVVARADPAACPAGQADKQVEVTADTPDPDPTNNTDAWSTHIAGQADLWIGKEALAASMTAGEVLSYTLTVTNEGPGCATDVEVLDLVPAGTASAGRRVTYTLTVWNLGPQPAAGLLVTDTLRPGVALAWAGAGCTEPGAGTVVCAAPLIEAGQALSFALGVTVDAGVEPGTSLENAAVVASLANDPNPANNVDAADTSIVGRTDLALSKIGPEWIARGGLVTYQTVVTSDGPSAAQSVDVKDDLPAGIALVSASIERRAQAPALCGGSVCQPGDMAVGEVVTVTLVGQAAPDLTAGLVLTNVATVFSDTPEEELSNNRDEHAAPVHSLSIYLSLVVKGHRSQPSLPDLVGSFTLTPDQNEYRPDESVLITVVVTNRGDVAAGAFWVDFYLNPDPVPTGPGLPWNEACSLSPCYGLTWEVAGGLPPGASVTLTSTPDSFDVARSLWTGYLAPGTSDLYLFVDSWSPDSPVGAVLELDETNNRAERHGLLVRGGDGAIRHGGAGAGSADAADGPPPPRPTLTATVTATATGIAPTATPTPTPASEAPPVVPEPATVLLLCSALAGIGGYVTLQVRAKRGT